jgi:putative ABC transport system ATP-binding protein
VNELGSDRPAIEIDDATLIFNRHRPDEVQALSGVSLTVDAGELVTVVGANGAGKSSLVHIVAGTVRPTTGQVRIGGRDVTRWPDHRRAGLVTRVFDDPRIGTAPELSIEDNLAMAMSRGRRRTLRFALNAKRRRTMQEHLAALNLGLETRLHDPVGQLSAGQRQSLTLVLAALGDPAVLLLDEHLAALDPATARRVLGLTSDVVAAAGCATLMVTHNMEHALATGSRVVVMSRGRIVGDVSGDAKRDLRPTDLIDLITGAGDAVSDRLLLPDFDPNASRLIELTKAGLDVIDRPVRATMR